MTHDSQSTPITPEGLRGLGMNRLRSPDEWWLEIPNASRLFIEERASEWRCYFGTRMLGTAPDLETVGRLIEVLRRMNGGG